METKKVKYNGMVKTLLTIVVCLVNGKIKSIFSIVKQVTNNQKLTTKIVTVYALLLTSILTAQVYPVQVTPQLVPPYSLKLSDYETTSSEKLFVNLLLTDVSELGRQVRLKMYIEGEGLNIQTLDFVAGANPINLDGGINARLSNLDLRPYFNFNNLLGITTQQYNSSLPEGRYDFCFEVYDFVSGQQLSRKSCFSVYLILNEPPILNTPGNSDLVTAKNPQNIIFNWTPRHLNATNVQYEYTLKELWDTKIDPQAAFLASPALHQENTFATTLLYGPANTTLLEGKTYGWQVRALVSDGISETSVFRNDGYSEIFYFKYAGDCDTPSFIISEAENSNTVKILWQFSDHIRYEIQYRKKGYGDDDWFNVYAYNQETTIRNLEEGTVYEFRVGGECTPEGGFAFSTIHEFTTPTEEETAYYNCGIPPEIEISNQDPLPKIGAGETFTAGDFPVVVVEATGSNGNFSGWGYITLPFLAKVNQAINVIDNLTGGEESGASIGKYTRIRVAFKSVSINTDYQLTAGTVETSYDADWGGILSADDLIDYVTGDEGDIASYNAENINISEVIVNDAGNIILIDTNGNEIPIEVRKPVVITDSEGEQWIVNEDGTVTEGGVAAEGGVPTNDTTNGIANNGDVTQISSKDITVVFKPSGFYDTDALRDEITDEKFIKNYETIPQANGGDYKVLYKALSDLSSNPTDFITAEASFSNNTTKEDIVFKTKQGTAVDATWSGNTATLNLKKSFDFGKDEILATVKPKDSTAKYDVAGKVNVWHLAQQEEINVTIVPVGENAIGENNTIKADLDAIYNPVGIKFNVTIEDEITIKKDVWDVENDNDELDIGDSNTLANYTIEERALYNYYKEQRGVAEKMYYIFVLGDITTTDETINGFMPLKRQYGFVFNKTTSGRTIAHELGHGIFGLEHPFNEYDIPKESTDLLMDYNNGTAFTQMDWQTIHEPGLQLYWFQGDEDGEQVTVTDISELKEFANSDGTFTFISRSGKPITVPANISEVIFSTGDSQKCEADTNDPFRVQPFGTLSSFVFDNTRYTAYWKCVSKKFTGYKSDGVVYEDTKTNKSITKAIVGFPTVVNNGIIFKVGTLNITPEEGGENYTAEGDYEKYKFLVNRLSEITKFNEISAANFEPALSQEVQQFILNNINKEGFDGTGTYDNDAYVFIHATHLEKYEVLKGCFKNGVPGGLLQLILKTHYNRRAKTTVETTPVFDENYEPGAEIFDAKSLINHWEKYDLNYYPVIAEQIKDFEILKDADHDDIIEAFRGIMNINYENVTSDNWDCFFESLDSEKFAIVLKALSDDDDWGNETENLLLKFFSLADNNTEREQKLLDLLEDVNEDKIKDYKLLSQIVKITDDWGENNNPQFDEIINYISSWLIKRSNKNLITDIVKQHDNWKNSQGWNSQGNITFDYKEYSKLNIIPIAKDNMFGFAGPNWLPYSISTNLEETGLNISVEVGNKTGGTINGLAFKNNYSPYDYVVLDVLYDFKIGNQEFKKGYFLVPSIFVHWLGVSINGRNSEAVVRVLAEAIAIAAIPLTAGGSVSIALALEGTLATADIVFTIANNVDNESLLGNEKFFYTWTAIYGIYNLKHLPSLVKSIGSGGKALFKFGTEVGEAIHLRKLIIDPTSKVSFLAEFKKLSVENKLDVIFKLDDLALAIKKESDVSINSLSKRIIYRTLLELKLECNAVLKGTDPFEIVIKATSTPYSPALVFNYNNKLTDLGTVLLSDNKVVTIVESSKWLPSNVTTFNELAEIPSVITNINGIRKVSNIKVVEDASDSKIYISLAAGFAEDFIKNKTELLIAERLKHNPNFLTHNCATCAIKSQNEVTKGASEVIEEITKNYKNGVPAEEVHTVIKNVFGESNVKVHDRSFGYDMLNNKLQDIHQESVILMGALKEPNVVNGIRTTHHVFNARRIGNKQWEIIDVQKGEVYDQIFIDKIFSSIEIFEVLYKDHKYISRNLLKKDLPDEVYPWIDSAPETLLNKLEEFSTDKLKQFVNEFDNDISRLKDFNEDILLLKSWEIMEKKNIPVKWRTRKKDLENAKKYVCN